MNNAEKKEYFMFLIKVFLTSLIGISLSTADISGIVTDTSGTVPISGAIVSLEKGGQTATTGSNGRFTLILGNAGIFPSNGNQLLNGLSAAISGNLMTVTIAKRSAVEVTTFDLSGNALLKVHKTMEAGSNSIVLPQRGAGIYLYKVKAGNTEFVIKGNTVGNTLFGSSETTHGTSSNHLAKQAEASAAINDVIAATKDGYLNYRCVQYNPDASGIVIKMIANAGDLTDVDGNVYQTVKIGNQVWMAENLRVTKFNDGSPIRNIVSATTWDSTINWSSPAYCYYLNTTNTDSIKKYGALYNSYAVSGKKLAPPGWHVPSKSEWETLWNYMKANDFNGKALAAKTDWIIKDPTTGIFDSNLTLNNYSGFSALPAGLRLRSGAFLYFGTRGQWWSSTSWDATRTYTSSLDNFEDQFYQFILHYNKNNFGYSVRLVKD